MIAWLLTILATLANSFLWYKAGYWRGRLVEQRKQAEVVAARWRAEVSRREYLDAVGDRIEAEIRRYRIQTNDRLN